MTDQLGALRELAEELRAVLVDERAAIASLDHARLAYLADHKQRVAHALAEVRAKLPGAEDPDLRAVFEALRIEARANAMLAATAAQAVRALLGYESTGSYDRRARPNTFRLRALATL